MGIFGKKREIADIYIVLRKQALTLGISEIGLKPDKSKPVYGVLMETGYDDAVVTLSAIGDGSVSLYFSNGGGIIGLGEHQNPRKACFSLISLANEFSSQLQTTKNFPLPKKGHTTFYFLTVDGVLMFNAKEDDLGNNRLPLSPFFHKAKDVITEARVVDEKRQRDFHELMHAATTGEVRKTKLLIENGANIDNADPTGLTPLMAASYSGHLEIIELLLQAGALIDVKDSSGYTALMFSCKSGELSCVRYLIENGANINEIDNDGSMPIMFCAQHGHNEVVKCLLEKGVDPTVEGRHGFSAIGIAKQNGLAETVKLLEEKK